jgi:hypothetical protein
MVQLFAPSRLGFVALPRKRERSHRLPAPLDSARMSFERTA